MDENFIALSSRERGERKPRKQAHRKRFHAPRTKENRFEQDQRTHRFAILSARSLGPVVQRTTVPRTHFCRLTAATSRARSYLTARPPVAVGRTHSWTHR